MFNRTCKLRNDYSYGIHVAPDTHVGSVGGGQLGWRQRKAHRALQVWQVAFGARTRQVALGVRVIAVYSLGYCSILG